MVGGSVRSHVRSRRPSLYHHAIYNVFVTASGLSADVATWTKAGNRGRDYFVAAERLQQTGPETYWSQTNYGFAGLIARQLFGWRPCDRVTV